MRNKSALLLILLFFFHSAFGEINWGNLTVKGNVGIGGTLNFVNATGAAIVTTGNVGVGGTFVSTGPIVGASTLSITGNYNGGTWNATTIALNKGGTGQTTKAAAFDALSPMTTINDMIYGGTAGTGTRLPAGTTGQYLGSVNAIPTWINGPQVTNSQTGTYAIATVDNIVMLNCAGGSFTATLPTAVGVTGKTYTLIRTNQTASVAVTVATTSSQTIGGFASSAITLDIQNEALTVVSDGANWQILHWDIPIVHYTLTASGPAGWSTTISEGTVFKTRAGIWRLAFNIEGTLTASASISLTVTGVAFKSGMYQSFSASDISNGTRYITQARAENTNTLRVDLSGTSTDILMSGFVRLNAKPTIAM